MYILDGIAVSAGIAIGEAVVIDNEGFRIPDRLVDHEAVDDELARWHKSVAAVSDEIRRNRDRVAAQLGDHYGAIFSAQLQMLCDPQLQRQVEQLIRQQYSPEYAVSRTLRGFARVFQALENKLMAERANDVLDIEKRLLGELLGRQHEELLHLKSPAIILTANLTPSEAAHLDPSCVLGFVCEVGGAGSHTAIVAEALEIPAVVGTGRFLAGVSGGDTVIVDGHQGRVILQPDAATLACYRQRLEQRRTMATQLEALRGLTAETADGHRVELLANIEFPREVDSCLARGADGIGLYRTEFLYLAADREPTEDDHWQAYSQVVAAMEGRPVVIRTLDLGADKLQSSPNPNEERNPFLGLRSIRLALRNRDLFRTQLRAILRASALGPVRVMFPLISTLQELRHARSILADTMEDLEEEGAAFDRQIPVGMMVEVPAAVMLMDRFAKEVDFISIGTNDLIQYALAVDRSNTDVASLYNPADPAVLRLIQATMNAVRCAGEEVHATLCGQMSANRIFTMLLLGLGLRSLSVPPSSVPEIKHICRLVTLPRCEQVANKALTMETAVEITDYLSEELRRVTGES
jgi:phosphotransferase system enzyme I (PtsI)